MMPLTTSCQQMPFTTNYSSGIIQKRIRHSPGKHVLLSPQQLACRQSVDKSQNSRLTTWLCQQSNKFTRKYKNTRNGLVNSTNKFLFTSDGPLPLLNNSSQKTSQKQDRLQICTRSSNGKHSYPSKQFDKSKHVKQLDSLMWSMTKSNIDLCEDSDDENDGVELHENNTSIQNATPLDSQCQAPSQNKVSSFIQIRPSHNVRFTYKSRRSASVFERVTMLDAIIEIAGEENQNTSRCLDDSDLAEMGSEWEAYNNKRFVPAIRSELDADDEDEGLGDDPSIGAVQFSESHSTSEEVDGTTSEFLSNCPISNKFGFQIESSLISSTHSISDAEEVEQDFTH